MSHVTMKIGSFSKAITKASDDRNAVLVQAQQAAENGLVVLVKRDCFGRWQAWAKRRNPLGATAHTECEAVAGAGRRAKRVTITQKRGAVYLADTDAACGDVECEVVIVPSMEASYTGDEDAARQFATRRSARDAAARRGVTNMRIVRHCSMWNHPASDGGYLILDCGQSRPCQPVYVA